MARLALTQQQAPDGTFNKACQTEEANTVGQTIGLAPVPLTGATGTGAMPLLNL